MWVIKYRKIWFALSAVLLALSIWAMIQYGFKLSIDFVGGTLTEVGYENSNSDMARGQIEAALKSAGIESYSIRPSGTDHYVVRTHTLTDTESSEFTGRLLSISSTRFTIERQNSIGPIAGTELKSKAMKAISVVVLMIVLFVTFAFRKVSKPVSSWKYGFATIIALAHDVIIPTGIFVFLGYIAGVEIDLLFVTGLLAILGYSVHDTIVVFDRVRENLHGWKDGDNFEEVVGRSVSQTFARSINTSLTIFITLLALYLFGSSATKDFALLLIVGLIAGTYSSIFIASPLLVTFFKPKKS